MAEVAELMDCELLNIWPGQDGYDYMLTADYEQERQWFCEAIAKVAKEFPKLRFALDTNPRSREPTAMSRVWAMPCCCAWKQVGKTSA